MCTPAGLADDRTLRDRAATGHHLTNRLVDATGTIRRLQACGARGWTVRALAELSGIEHTEIFRLQRGDRSHVTPRTAAAVRHLNDVVHARPAPVDPPGRSSGCARARAHAQRQDWPLLDEWLDGEIDDPAAVSDRAYRRTGDERIATDDLVWLTTPAGGGLTPELIAARVGLSREAVERRLCRRAGAARSLSDDDVYAIRAEYVRTRGRGWQGTKVAARYGVAKSVISELITGRKPARLGLSDLTAPVQRTEAPRPVATPGDADRKEAAAA